MTDPRNDQKAVPARRYALLCLCTVGILLLAADAYAQMVQSSLGYRSELPDDWIILSREKIRSKPGLFEHDHVDGLPDELWQQIKPMILSGQVEMYWRPAAAGAFIDNINVFKQAGSIPAGQPELDSLCDMLPGEFSNAFRRQINLYTCTLTTIGEHPALYLEFDGAMADTRSLQYQLSQSTDNMLIITATASTARLADIRQVLQHYMASYQQH